MKNAKTLRHDTYKRVLKELLDKNPEARLIAKKYKALAYTLQSEWPSKVSKDESFYNFLQDVVYIDRLLRKMTEGEDVENKKIAEQEAQIELGYESGANVRLPPKHEIA